MNCPQCKQRVGADQFAVDRELRPVRDAAGAPVGVERSIYVACGHCGPFELVQDQSGAITTIIHAVRRRDICRIESRIPSCIADRPIRRRTLTHQLAR